MKIGITIECQFHPRNKVLLYSCPFRFHFHEPLRNSAVKFHSTFINSQNPSTLRAVKSRVYDYLIYLYKVVILKIYDIY